MKGKSKSKFKRFFFSLLKISLCLYIASILLVVLLKWVPIYVTPLMIKRQFQGIEYTKKEWVSIDDISKNLPLACISSEDNLFQKHNGFSWNSMKKAYEHNKDGKKRRGGSTISQQTAKNVFTFCTPTYSRKLIEAHYTFWIELIWGKKRIMEVYLNVAEWGSGIYGAEAAAQVYYKVPASKLTKPQSAMLAAALPSPLKYSVTKPGPYMRKRQRQIMNLMPKMSKMTFLEE